VIERALYARLNTDSGVRAHAGIASSPQTSRVYPILMPQHESGDLTNLPCVVYTKVATERQALYTSTDSLVRATVQIDCYGRTATSVLALAEAVKDSLLSHTSATTGGVYVSRWFLDTDSWSDDPEPGLFRVTQTWSVWHTE
jgi:hypothetical protein